MSIDKRLVRKESLEKLFDILKQNSKTIFAPVSKNGKISFKVSDSYSSVEKDYIQTTQSSKNLHSQERKKFLITLKIKIGISVKPFDYQTIPEVVIWGVRPCDAMGIGELSAIFNWDSMDEIYNNRSQKPRLLVFSCFKADESCFCTSVGGNPGNTEGSDILFTRLGEDGDYLAEIITEKGAAIVAIAEEIFQKTADQDKNKYLAEVPVKFDRDTIRKKLDTFFESEEWVEHVTKMHWMRCMCLCMSDLCLF